MKVIILLLICLISSITYAQNCRYRIGSNNFVGTLQDSIQAVSYSFTIRRRSNSNNCKNFRAYVSRGNSTNYNRFAQQGSNTVPYNLYSDSSLQTVLKDYPDAVNAGEYIAGNLANRNTNYSFNFFVKLVDLDSVFSSGPGHFGDNIQISFYGVRNNGSLVYQRTAYVYYQIIVPRYAELSLVPLSGNHDPSVTLHTVNFGNLTSNDVKSATLNVKGNVGFGVYMSSQNGSKLKNASSEVPYQIRVGPSSYKTLSTPGNNVYMFQRNSGTSQNAESYPIDVKLGSVPGNAATGNYSDNVTVTVTAW